MNIYDSIVMIYLRLLSNIINSEVVLTGTEPDLDNGGGQVKLSNKYTHIKFHINIHKYIFQNVNISNLSKKRTPLLHVTEIIDN